MDTDGHGYFSRLRTRGCGLIVVAGLLIVGQAVAGEGRTLLPLGDSITAGGKGFPTYREYLAPALAKHGVVFIGPRKDEYSAHAGWGGRNSGFLLEKIDAIYQEFPADIVLLHSGHNHQAKDQPVPRILEDTEAIIRRIHKANPKAVVLVAQVISSGKLPKYGYLGELNDKLPGLVEELRKDGLPVVLADVGKGFDWRVDALNDKVHPNAQGAEKMAKNWLKALAPVLEGKP